jgi:hypothetical protein
LLHKVERQAGNLRNAQLKKELVEANSTISILKSDLETAQAKNRSDIGTIKIQQMKIENVVSKCAAYKVSTKKCQDEFSEKEKETNKERYNIKLFLARNIAKHCSFFPRILLINLFNCMFRRVMAEEMDSMRQQVVSIIYHKSSAQGNTSPSEVQEMPS